MSSGQLKGLRTITQTLQTINLNKEVLRAPDFNCNRNRFLSSILSPDTISNIELVKFEFDKINQLFNEKISNPIAKKTFTSNLEEGIEIIEFLVELSTILRRIQPYWEVVDEGILPLLKIAVEKVDSSTLNIKKQGKYAVCEEIKKLEESKMKLSDLYYYAFAQMEWFVLFYRSSSLKDKESFFSKLNENSAQMAWIAPFIEIAEEGDLTWTMALTKALNFQEISETEIRRVYV